MTLVSFVVALINNNNNDNNHFYWPIFMIELKEIFRQNYDHMQQQQQFISSL